jgi:lysophospholipase L1-like esterase
MTSYSRYVALGDSQTEGLGDGDEIRGYRGLADRLAEHLAMASPELHYANLSVRGRLAAQVLAEQLAPALRLRPDLATVIAGMNDLIRPGFDARAVAASLEEMFAALTKAGAHVLTVTFPDIGKIAPLARPLLPRVLALNEHIREAAARHDVTVVDTFPHAFATDARMAAAFAHALGLPGSDETWQAPLDPVAPRGRLRSTGTEVRWIAGFAGPWIYRRIRGRSSGDGRTAKRPDLGPVLLHGEKK